MEYRQHHADGNSQNLALIEQQLQLPDPSSSNYFGAIIYLSQIFQAQAIKMQTEHYRSYKGRLEENGKGLTMGALYWQLNDVWVAPTWSGIGIHLSLFTHYFQFFFRFYWKMENVAILYQKLFLPINYHRTSNYFRKFRNLCYSRRFRSTFSKP